MFKKSTNWHFFKGVNPRSWSKNGHFSNFFFQAIYAWKISFTIFQNEKTTFQAIKARNSKSRTFEIFTQGLTHGFNPKMAIFPTFFSQVIQSRKIFFTIFQNEKTAFQAIKTRISKTRKIDIFTKGLPMVLVQKLPFFQVSFFRQYSEGKYALRYSRTKKRLFRLKKEMFKKSKN